MTTHVTPRGDEAAYLLWLREGTLVAQAFDTARLSSGRTSRRGRSDI
jgi:hypothetical protein